MKSTTHSTKFCSPLGVPALTFFATLRNIKKNTISSESLQQKRIREAMYDVNPSNIQKEAHRDLQDLARQITNATKEAEFFMSPPRSSVNMIFNDSIDERNKYFLEQGVIYRANVILRHIISLAKYTKFNKSMVLEPKYTPIDDIINTGGTISNAVKELKKRKSKSVTVIASHGIFANDDAGDMSDFIGDFINVKTFDESLNNCLVCDPSGWNNHMINRMHKGFDINMDGLMEFINSGYKLKTKRYRNLKSACSGGDEGIFGMVLAALCMNSGAKINKTIPNI